MSVVSPTLRIGATGFGLIAVCYGLARFAFGLFLPQIGSDLALSATLSGVISGGSFLGYCFAIVISAHLTERMGPRAVAVAAGLIAGIGMLGIALSPSAAWLTIAVLIAGSSTGLASPPLAAAVMAMVPPVRQDTTNTVINAGTSVGVVLSGPVALALGAEWRLAFAGFAGIAILPALATLLTVPGHTGEQSTPSHGFPKLSPDLARLITAAFLTGAASTVVWTFGGELVSSNLDWGGGQVGILWIAIGVAGIFGAAAGSLIERFGITAVHLVFLAGMSAGILAVGSGFTTSTLALIGGSLFGASYVMLTGVYLVWGVAALTERPATGLMVAFLMLAIGQTLGAPVFGLVTEYVSSTYAVFAFAALALSAGLAYQRKQDGLSTSKP